MLVAKTSGRIGSVRIVWSCILLVSALSSSYGIFIEKPENKTVFLNNEVTIVCSTNSSNYLLVFEYNKQPSNSSSNQINLPNGGVRITVNFVITNERNGTTVTCAALETADHKKNVSHTEPAIVLAQGAPNDIVRMDRLCVLNYTGFISWEPLFSLPGLLMQYQVNITNPAGNVTKIVTSDLSYSFETKSTGQHTVSIVPMNQVGIGNKSVMGLDFSGSEILGLQDLNDTIRNERNWTNQFSLKRAGCLMQDSNWTINDVFHCNTSTCVSAKTFQRNGLYKINSISNLELDNKYNTSVNITYRDRIFDSKPVTISTHDLQNLRLINTSVEEMCLNFTIVSGHTIKQIHVHFEFKNRTIHRIQNVTVDKMSNFVIHCFKNLDANQTLTVKACDGPAQNDKCSNPAAVLPGVMVKARDKSSFNQTSGGCFLIESFVLILVMLSFQLYY